MSLDDKYLKTTQRDYHRSREAAVDTIAEAMCELYKSITHKTPSDRLREALHYAILGEL